MLRFFSNLHEAAERHVTLPARRMAAPLRHFRVNQKAGSALIPVGELLSVRGEQ